MDVTIVKALPDYLVKALCSTLIQSLWQGVLLAALAGIIIVCTRRSSPASRYNLLMAGLAVFACTVVVTFIYEVNQEKAVQTVVTGQQLIIHSNVVAQPQASPKVSDYKAVSSFLNGHSNSIVFIWLLVVMARTLQLMTGLQSLYYLRRRQILAVSRDWESRVKQLALQLGIKRLVGIAESGMAKVPMVIGHLKPLILIPAGLMTAMPPAEIEAILVHELAHIRRRDYIMNLLVSMMEVIFFFNPAVLWIASLIRAERENCCDDMVVSHTGNKVNYIKALVACQEYQLATPAYAMALSGGKNQLMGRVKRMLSDNNQSLNVMERSMLAVALVATILLTTAFSHKENIDQLVNKMVHAGKTALVPHKQTKPPANPAKPKSIEKNAHAASPVTKDTSYKTQLDTSLFRIYRPDEVGDHTSLTFPNDGVQTRLLKVDGVLYQVNTLNGRVTSMQVNGKTIRPNEYAPYLLVVDKETQRKPVVAPVAQAAQAAQVARQPDPITPINTTAAGNVNGQVGLRRLNGNLGSLKSTLNAYDASSKAYNGTAVNYSAVNPYPANYKAYHDDSNRAKLTDDLITEGIIHSSDELTSFKLSDTEFIVNGKRIPDNIYQKFKKAYVKQPEKGKQGSWSWMYNYTEQTEPATGDHSQ
ncbi:M56 family metallopeptidase [Mucilaginibacter rubeus]|uniref:M56 family metallopeptidase n=1 Tax=Mucilaginibacter rubeus TaxID=2027860 RepID=A0A5C1HSC1_9SPHI|nr:M56 family metallopeptidase [Mucilaginibacter rubeus]QEM08515.1 M56 family metallopeptidase [Mucilaginibacter rubeus]